MYKCCLLLIATLTSCVLFAGNFPSNYSYEKAAFYKDTVNLITQDFDKREIDLTVVAPETIFLQRRYFSLSIQDKHYGQWHGNLSLFLVVGKDEKETVALTGEKEGLFLEYRGNQNLLQISNNLNGLNNCFNKEIHAKSNFLNNQLTYDSKKDCYQLQLADGTLRHYTPSKKPFLKGPLFFGEKLLSSCSEKLQNPTFYHLTLEILPSGLRLIYTYDDSGRPLEIFLKDAKEKTVMAFLKFKYVKNTIICESSNNYTVTYKFGKEEEKLSLLEEVILPGNLSLNYDYEINEKGTFLKKVKYPDGYWLEISYDERGKIQKLDESGGLFARFVCKDHSTELYNAKDQKKVISFDENHHLLSIDTFITTFQGSYLLYKKEKSFWNKNYLLLGKSIEDGNGNIHFFKTYRYDNYGDVLEEKTYGNLTGGTNHPIFLNKDGFPLDDKNEVHKKNYKYFDNPFHTLIEEGDEKKGSIVYEYKDGTNLLTSKITFSNDAIKLRTFYEYDENGILIRETVDDGNEWAYTNFNGISERHFVLYIPKKSYPAFGSPEKIEKGYYSIKGNKRKVTLSQVNTYDNFGNLTKKSFIDEDKSPWYSMEERYDDRGNLIEEISPLGDIVSYSYNKNNDRILEIRKEKSLTFVYDEKRHLVSIEEKLNSGDVFTSQYFYDVLGNLITYEDPYNNRTSHEYDSLNRVVKTTFPSIKPKDKVVTPFEEYEYDIWDNIIWMKDAKGWVTNRCYNLRKQPTYIEYPDETKELFRYDTEGSLHRKVERDKTVWIYEYDFLSRLKNIEHFTQGKKGPELFLGNQKFKYNTFHCLFSESYNQTNEISSSVNYNYNEKGELLSEERLLNKYSQEKKLAKYTYDTRGNIKFIEKPWGKENSEIKREAFVYDILGRVIEERTEDIFGNVLLCKKKTYDSRSNVTQEIEYPNGIETVLHRYVYDDRNNLVKIIDALGKESTISYDYFYQNDLGQKVLRKTIQNFSGNQTILTFDAFSRIVSETQKSQDGSITTSKNIFFDELSNKISEEVCDNHGKTQQTSWEYGPMHRLDVLVEAANSPDEKKTYYSYSSTGQLNKKTYSNASDYVQFFYDTRNQLIRIYGEYNNGESFLSNNYYYDDFGRVIKAKTSDGIVVEREYNFTNEVTKEKISCLNDPSRNEIDTSKDFWTTIKFSYDWFGRITFIDLPENGTSNISYKYNGAFLREIIRKTEGSSYNHKFISYDPMGNLLTEDLPYIGQQVTHTYDKLGRQIEISSLAFSQKIPENGFDNTNNILVTETRALEEHTNTSYTYDVNSRVLSEKGLVSHSYLYDAFGNRVIKDQKENQFNALNEILSADGTSFMYDPHGNIKSSQIGEKTFTFKHDINNHLISATTPNGKDINFQYDAFGRKIVRQKEGFDPEYYYYIGLEEIGSVFQKKHQQKIGIYGTSQCMAIELEEKPYIPLFDLFGNVAILLDKTGQVVEKYSYTAFGEETIYNSKNEVIEKSAISNPWRYFGKRKDEDLGFIFFGERCYEPSNGRWISCDPMGYAEGSNLYLFVKNNPLVFFDKWGLSTADRYTQAKNFEEYFYQERSTNDNRGGEIKSALFNKQKACFFDIESISSGISKPYDLNLSELSEGEIGFINGIMTNFNGAREHAEYLSHMAQEKNIHGIHKAPHGVNIDIVECCLGFGSNPIVTNAAMLVKSQWKKFFARDSVNKYLQICHSGGAGHVRTALMMLPPEERQRIIVVAVSPDVYISKKLCYQAYNLVSKRDIIPGWDKYSTEECSKDDIYLLDPHPDAHLLDHDFESPTFRKPLQFVIRDYINNPRG